MGDMLLRSCDGSFFLAEGVFEVDAGAHGGAEVDGFDELAFDGGGFGGAKAVEEGGGVFCEFFGAEAEFAEADVDDGLFVDAVFNFAGF